MPLHSILTTILAEYPKAKIEPFGGNPLANFLRHQAADEALAIGRWHLAFSVFDPAITPLETFLASQNCHAYQDNRASIALQIHHRAAAHAV